MHGYGNNHAQWCGYTNVELYAEERQIAVVMISGENKKYIDQDEDLFARFYRKMNYQNLLLRFSLFLQEKKILILQDFLWVDLVLFIMD